MKLSYYSNDRGDGISGYISQNEYEGKFDEWESVVNIWQLVIFRKNTSHYN